MTEARPETGLFDSLRRTVATLIALGQTRLELVSVEIEEQIEFATGVLLWSIAAIFFGSLAVLVLALTVVIAFWDTHRLLVAGLVTAALAGIAGIAVLAVRSRLRNRPRLLASTLDELRRDAKALEPDAE